MIEVNWIQSNGEIIPEIKLSEQEIKMFESELRAYIDINSPVKQPLLFKLLRSLRSYGRRLISMI